MDIEIYQPVAKVEDVEDHPSGGLGRVLSKPVYRITSRR